MTEMIYSFRRRGDMSSFTAVPRMPMAATGVATFMSPVLATWPATKLAAPCTKRDQRRVRRAACVVGQVVQHQPRVGAEVEGGAVDQAPDRASSCCRSARRRSDRRRRRFETSMVTPLRTMLALPVILATWPTTLAAGCRRPGRIGCGRSARRQCWIERRSIRRDQRRTLARHGNSSAPPSDAVDRR